MSRLVGSGLAACAVFGAGSATALAGPVTSKVIVSSNTLKPGVLFTHSRITVKGAWGVQNVYKLSWPIGDRHVRLHSSLLGTYDPSSGYIVDHGISHLASVGGPAGMIAAMTGDYSVYEGWSPVTSRTSGMLVQNRQVFRIGDGGPAVVRRKRRFDGPRRRDAVRRARSREHLRPRPQHSATRAARPEAHR